MVTISVRLKSGVQPSQVLDQLRPLIMEAGNIVARGIGVNGVTDMRDAYLMWVETVEMQLRSVVRDPDFPNALQTARYWHIRELELGSPRPSALIQAEVDVQQVWLKSIFSELELRMRQAARAPGHPTVLDTHVLLHYEPPAMIPWLKVLGQPAVRLIVPLRVIEELDEKKYAKRDDLADRARRILPQLERIVGRGGEAGHVRDGVTLEVPVAEGRARPGAADEEILGVAQELRQFGQQEVSLVTADTGLRISAEAHGVSVVGLPEEYERRKRPATAPQPDG